ncbi:MAG: DivIVA domain-containing protein, partial [Oligoflexia bacterium]|nr:DivIVA domain-containing protein [Oligoflexia bacterium]
MNYSGIDIQLKDFKKSMRGYDINEVRVFLDDLSRQVESISYENKVLKDKLREKELSLLEFREREETLKDTMLTAQKVTENIRNEANREATHIINQAKVKAAEILGNARFRMKSTLDE